MDCFGIRLRLEVASTMCWASQILIQIRIFCRTIILTKGKCGDKFFGVEKGALKGARMGRGHFLAALRIFLAGG